MPQPRSCTSRTHPLDTLYLPSLRFEQARHVPVSPSLSSRHCTDAHTHSHTPSDAHHELPDSAGRRPRQRRRAAHSGTHPAPAPAGRLPPYLHARTIVTTTTRPIFSPSATVPRALLGPHSGSSPSGTGMPVAPHPVLRPSDEQRLLVSPFYSARGDQEDLEPRRDGEVCGALYDDAAPALEVWRLQYEGAALP